MNNDKAIINSLSRWFSLVYWVTAACLLIYFYLQLQQQDTARWQQTLSLNAELHAKHLEKVIVNANQQLERIANSAVFEGITEDYLASNDSAHLARYQDFFRHLNREFIDVIWLVDSNGMVLASNQSPTPRLELKTLNTHANSPLIVSTQKSNTSYYGITYLGSNPLQLVARFQTKAFELTESNPNTKGMTTLLVYVDDKGNPQLLSTNQAWTQNPEHDEELQQSPLRLALHGSTTFSAHTLDTNNHAFLAAGTPVSGVPWGVVSVVPRHTVRQQQLKHTGIALGIAILIWGSALIWLWKRKESAPSDLALNTGTGTDDYRWIHALPDGAVITDEQGVIIHANAPSSLLFGRRLRNLQGLNLYELIKPKQDKAFDPDLRIQHAIGPEFYVLQLKGNTLEVEIAFHTLNNHHTLALLRDRTHLNHFLATQQSQLNRAQLLLDCAQEGLWDWNITNNKVAFSKAWFVSLGYEPYELPEHLDTFIERLHPKEIDSVRNALREVLAGKRTTFSATYRLNTKDGTWRSFKGHGRVVSFDNGGEPIRFIGTHYDVTQELYYQEQISQLNRELTKHLSRNTLALHQAHNALDESESQLRAVLENTYHLLGVLDTEGHIMIANKASLQVIDQPFEAVKGKLFWDTPWWQDNPEQQEQLKQAVAQAAKGELVNFEATHTGPDGTAVHVDFSLVPVLNEHHVVTFLVAEGHDITKLKNTQTHLEKLSETAHTARRIAEAATSAKSEFLANMSHEIRTPMNAIIGLSKLLLNTPLDSKQKDFLTKLHNASGTLLSIINDILDFSKIEAGKMSLEHVPFSIFDTLENLSTLFAYSAQAKGLTLLFDIAPNVPTELVGDPVRITQVLSNLLSNAIKFTAEGSITLSIALKQVKGNKARIEFSVQDTGIGLSGKQIANLFKPFNQADSSTTRRFGGTGLGLAISKRLIELMGGRFHVQSEFGHYSRFYFDTLLDLDAEGASLTPPQIEQDVLLLVEHAKLAEHLRLWLDHWGITTLEAAQHPLATTTTIVITDNTDAKHLESLHTRHHKVIELHPANKALSEHKTYLNQNQYLLYLPVLIPRLSEALVAKLASTEEHHAATNLDAIARLRGKRLLLVEDNDINQQVAKEMLSGNGFRVDIANNGKQAIERIKSNPYDAVLMDIQMPEMDGLDATRAIRQMPEFKALPIIAMTAHAMEEDRHKSFAAGMNAHITKPISTELLFKTLIEWIPAQPQDNEPAISSPAEPGASTPETNVPDQLPGLDVASALSRLNHKLPLYCKSLTSLIAQAKSGNDQIANQAEAEQWENITRHFHSMKSAFGTLGAMSLWESYARLETLSRQKDLSLLLPLPMELDAQLMDVESSLHVLIDLQPTSPDIDHAPIDLEQAMSELGSLLSHHRFIDLSLVDHITHFAHGNDQQLLAHRFTEQINNVDYDSALITLKALAHELGYTLTLE